MLAKKIGRETVLLPPPPDKIVFMLGYTPTMKEDALTLYDTGCGNLCMTDDIPHNYLKAIQNIFSKKQKQLMRARMRKKTILLTGLIKTLDAMCWMFFYALRCLEIVGMT